MGISQLGGSSYSRLVTKQNTAGVGTTAGATVQTGTANGALGAWTPLVASTSSEVYVVGVTVSSSSATQYQRGPYYVEIGLGGAGSETFVAAVYVVGVSGSLYLSGSNGAVTYNGGTVTLPVPVRVAAGQRITARISMAQNTNGVEGATVFVYTVPYANVEGN